MSKCLKQHQLDMNLRIVSTNLTDPKKSYKNLLKSFFHKIDEMNDHIAAVYEVWSFNRVYLRKFSSTYVHRYVRQKGQKVQFTHKVSSKRFFDFQHQLDRNLRIVTYGLQKVLQNLLKSFLGISSQNR